MKHVSKFLLIVALSLTVISGGSVLARTAEHKVLAHGFEPEDSTEIHSSDPVKTDAVSLEQRVQKRKADFKTKLLAAEERSIKLKCQASQGKVSSLSGRIKGIETSRTEVYKNTMSRLTKLSTKLKDKGLDTATLNDQLAELTTKINTFNNDLTAYKQAVSDLSALDCVKDPAAFKASLEAARTAQQTLMKDSTAIRSYLKDVIKPTLAALKTQLESDKKDDGTDD